MPQVRTPPEAPFDGILAAVADADRFRRRRRLTQVLAQVLPFVSACLLLIAAGIRFTQAPVSAFWMLLALAAAGLAIFAWVTVRASGVTDAAAARMDADAGLGGELRSAYWFTSQPAGDAWTSYHLERAADRVQQVSWPAVYPPIRAPRAWAGSTVLGALAVAIVSIHAWPLALRPSAGTALRPDGTLAPAGPAVSLELQKQIDELLKAVGKGELPMDDARVRLNDLRDALSKLDPALQAAAAKAAQDQGQKPAGKDHPPADKEEEELAARAEDAASDAALPEDVKWSLQDLAAKLAKASQQQSAPADAKSAADSKDAKVQGAQPQAGGPPQMVRMATVEKQTDPMMASSASPMAGDPSGASAEAARKMHAAAPLDLSGALHKQSVEAAADSEGANVLAEMRRKSEQSRSTLGFSHVAPLATYDPSRASAPPPTPDALRPLVQQYFIRR